jgi:hypothetical protein
MASRFARLGRVNAWRRFETHWLRPPDAKTILYARENAAGADLMLVESFRQGAQRLTTWRVISWLVGGFSPRPSVWSSSWIR